jgi:predicted Zn-dependent protease
MKKCFVAFVLPFLFVCNAMAEGGTDVSGALSRMESAIVSSNEEFTPEDGYYIGRAAAAHILGKYSLYTEKPGLTRYLNLICGVLTVNSTKPDCFNGYHVMVLDSNVPNAFSTPGGHIFLSRGLIDMAASEDMLAAVIAHELAHIQLSHGLAEIKHERLVGDLNREQARIAGMLEREQAFAEPVNEIVNTLLGKGYSRSQESEADSMAVTLLASSGYYPSSLADFLKRLEATQGSNSMIGSPPLFTFRITDAERSAARYYTPDTRPARQNRFNRRYD